MRLPTFLFKSNNHDHHQSNKHNSPWRQWPSCKHPKTLSFRVSEDMFRTVNSVFFDPNDVAVSATAAVVDTPESWFTNSSESASFSTESEEYYAGESLETVVHAARSERLFFEPGTDSSSILEKTNSDAGTGEFAAACSGSGAGELLPYRESVVLAMDSDDPCADFRRSMEEMVEMHGVKDWECLEELLGWYLRVNGKNNHGFIVGAFVDLLVDLATAEGSGGSGGCNDSSTTTTTTTAMTAETSFSSAVSCFSVNSNSSSPRLCCSDIRGRIVNEIDHEEERNLTR
ncbi:Ovate protein family, C-terminal [Parasponia andersonii]|uniref:Transcription repressor n=1 Tax=Parasponia andersonii TaxID=3476 RepID=A0A2P5DAG2_PARAD|nr:Ovate protein family, C-terminal [Parasponia andersonii]